MKIRQLITSLPFQLKSLLISYFEVWEALEVLALEVLAWLLDLPSPLHVDSSLSIQLSAAAWCSPQFAA